MSIFLRERAINKCDSRIAFIKMETKQYFKERHNNKKLGYDLMTTVISSNIRELRVWNYIKSKL